MKRFFIVLLLLSGLSACAGQPVGPAGTPIPTPDTLTTVVPPPTVRAEACDLPAKAVQVTSNFLSQYNAHSVDGVLGVLAPDFKQYVDAINGFSATASNIPEMRAYLTQHFNANELLQTGKIDASVDPVGAAEQYVVKVTGASIVQQGQSAITPRPARIELAVSCRSLKITLLAVFPG